MLSTKEKALSINLDLRYYGTIAEIGGGQETARHLFQAGGSSNTIAKSISAYDKNFSDAFYKKENKACRYVSEERLKQMLEKEYEQLNDILENNQKCFFAFANTVETINFHKTNQGHGWIGVCFSSQKNHSSPNTVHIHVRLHEQDSLLQQYTLGILGINLLYACFNKQQTPNLFLKSLMENLDTSRVEVDYARMGGPDLEYVNNRLLNVQLVRNGMTPAIMFDKTGEVHQAGNILYNKNILAFRGEFNPINALSMKIIEESFDKFKHDTHYTPESTIVFCEITLNSLINQGEIDEQDFLDRVDILNSKGQNVMVSNFREYYTMADYFYQFKIDKLRFVMGIPTFIQLWKKEYYKNLKGGILEAMGRLFARTTKLYLYPYTDEMGQIITSSEVAFEEDTEHLYQYLKINKRFIDLDLPESE